jgi:flagellar biosynthesis/type III secretory pathway M-ring protein FliF/YscJ
LISAVAAIIVIGGVVLAGLRLLVRRRSEPTSEPATKTGSEEDPRSETAARNTPLKLTDEQRRPLGGGTG